MEMCLFQLLHCCGFSPWQCKVESGGCDVPWGKCGWECQEPPLDSRKFEHFHSVLLSTKNTSSYSFLFLYPSYVYVLGQSNMFRFIVTRISSLWNGVRGRGFQLYALASASHCVSDTEGQQEIQEDWEQKWSLCAVGESHRMHTMKAVRSRG